ncbi:hypothetical protein VTK73DRAFT_4212 [Phialemonium thermophilum]|uniref:Zn(2)-C6 fungal-type domain-containing protein n=1 Tax=Phialemonium thermophilum TaxID=223376 RepID=A0ABR3VAU2_9PEZI
MDAAAPDFAARRRSWSQDTENGRRKKRAPRIRVTRACDRCKRKKIRCTGLQPCAICLRADAPCTYDATYSRGRRQQQPTITVGCGSLDGRSPVGEGSRVVHEALPGAHHRIQDDEDDVDMGGEDVNDGRNLPAPILSSRQHSDGGDDAGLAPPEGPPNRLLSTTAVPQPVPSSRTSPEPTQTDRQGHYVGPASGVSFLLRVQKRLHQTLAFSKTSSIFTFGDAPLPDVDLSFFVLPPRDEAQRLLDRYFDFAVPTHRFLHRPTVQGWLDELYETMGMLRDEDGAAARIAVLFMVFAQAREYLPSAPGPVSDVRWAVLLLLPSLIRPVRRRS